MRYNGTIHDFVMLNALRDTYAARAATAQGGEFPRAVLWERKNKHATAWHRCRT